MGRSAYRRSGECRSGEEREGEDRTEKVRGGEMYLRVLLGPLETLALEPDQLLKAGKVFNENKKHNFDI